MYCIFRKATIYSQCNITPKAPPHSNPNKNLTFSSSHFLKNPPWYYFVILYRIYEICIVFISTCQLGDSTSLKVKLLVCYLRFISTRLQAYAVSKLQGTPDEGSLRKDFHRKSFLFSCVSLRKVFRILRNATSGVAPWAYKLFEKSLTKNLNFTSKLAV
jgi:hypothetical protein